MKKHKTITISLPSELVDSLDRRIDEINQDTYQEINRSQYIRRLIRIDMSKPVTKRNIETTNNVPDASDDKDFFDQLLQLGGYKRQ